LAQLTWSSERTVKGAGAPRTTTSAPRMRKIERRHQLLDVAAALLADEDVKTVTMERIAERAGVSKALPYAHFDNAEHLLVNLYQRTSVALGESVWTALESAEPGDDLAHVWTQAHFRCGATQGVVFEALIRPGSAVPAKANRDGGGELFVGRLLHRYFGVDRAHADVISGVVLGAFLGASHVWLRAEPPRPTIERAVAELIRALVDTAPRCDVHDHDSRSNAQ